MKKKILFIFVLVLITSIQLNAQDTKTIISKAINVLSPTNSYQYSFQTVERINGSLITSDMDVRLSQSPHKVYLKNTGGKNKGKELLYVKGENNNKVLVNVAWGFSLNPFSSLIRKGNHHTILDTGFKSVKSILSDAKKRAEAENKFDKVFSYKGTITFKGRTCYKVEINDPTFSYINYTIKNGESTYQIAKRLNICEQLIIEKNSSLSGFDSAKDGMIIKIPSSYAKKTIIYIDTENYHSVYQELYDDKGLFEKYSFSNLVVNPKFKANEFTKDCESYDF